MNFTDLEFWALLLALLAGCLLLRLAFQGQSSGRLRVFDHLALAAINLTLFFHADALSCAILMAELFLTYTLIRFALNHGSSARYAALFVIIVLHIGVLGYFKYARFLVHDLLGFSWEPAARSIPAGISFYTFQKLALAIDTIRRNKPLPRPLDFFNYSTFFPQLVAGPIERRDALLPQIERFGFGLRLANFAEAIPMLVLGLFYKLVLADNLGAFELRDEFHNSYAIWLTNLLFGLRIYFDFAGYSFIALGLAKAFGVQLTLNFRAPYASASIREFWQRWHITLSTWFRDYVYLPLGGSRHGSWAFNIAVVFLVSGLWHGAGINFLLWGALHAVLMILGGWAGKGGWRVPHMISRPATLVAVCFSWLLFYETSFTALGIKIRALLTFGSYHPHQLSALISTSFPQSDRVPLAFIVALALAILCLEFRHRNLPNPYETLLDWRTSCALSLALVLFAHHGDSPFIYFAF